MSTSSKFLSSRYHMSAKAISKSTQGELTARTIRKARQGLAAANQRIVDYLENRNKEGLMEPTIAAVAVTPDPVTV